MAKHNTKRPALPRPRHWLITKHNYENDTIDRYIDILNTKCRKWVIGIETGKNDETPHLQIYINTIEGVSYTQVKGWLDDDIHLEYELDCKNAIKMEQYCKKENNFICSDPKLAVRRQIYNEYSKEYKNITWKEWQLEILSLKPDNRKVYWYWEPYGNTGKSFLTRYIIWKKKGILINNKESDAIYTIKQWIENNDDLPDYIIMDIPRSRLELTNYGLLEKIKNKVLTCGKYESCNLLIKDVVLIVFANEPPNRNALSEDRWVITQIV